ncbi:MAG: metallophosphoesterase [bacterium]|nr:metallophosphoesterase [bacterium]
MRFLHTADWQIQMSAAQFGERAAVVREARFVSLQRLMELARERACDFVVVAGDVFDTLDVPDAAVTRVARICASFGKPVYLLPGNHDPYVPASLWQKDLLWRDAPNVTRIARAEPIAVADGVTLFPTPLDRKHSSTDATAWIAGVESEGFRIGLAHGGVLGMGVGSPEHPIARDAAERLRLDYLALGDWHSLLVVPDAAGAPRTVYAGTHEQTAFDDRDPGNAVIVEIDAPGAAPRIEPVRVGELTWHLHKLDDLAAPALEALEGTLRALAPRERHLVRVELAGTLRGEAIDALRALRSLGDAGLLFFELVDRGIRSAPDDDAWIERLPHGVLREAARELRDAAEHDEVAMDALQALYDLASAHEEVA